MGIQFQQLDGFNPEYKPSGKICLFCKNDMQDGIILNFKGRPVHICKKCIEGFEKGDMNVVHK